MLGPLICVAVALVGVPESEAAIRDELAQYYQSPRASASWDFSNQ
jgi:hypothetical protein